ncbi:HlyD family secretion protein [Photobacterium nomapromontoriensis]|uniref:HlyD family secretion protein n=1 Tax=Photobacterium nomapromontoriensis TaxID=2910237 RepID=UPI003D10F3B5
MIKRSFLTGCLLVLAASAILWKYQQYLTNPWTRDGLVRARIVEITPRVTAPVIAMHVKDNSEVNAGDLLFEVDPRTYMAAVEKATASVAQAEALLQRTRDEAHRSQTLARRDPGAISQLLLTQQANAVQSAQAGVKAAQAAYDEAKLNLSFTKITAPVDGYITNLNLRVGSQVVANQPVVALIDKHSFWIEGFFKETDIQHVSTGMKASVTLMAYSDQPLSAHVASIGYGIAHKDGSTGVSLLPNVNPTFPWIRLAQRIPVTLRLDTLPNDIQLRIGTSASVMIHKHSAISLSSLLQR